jgi:periplasmic protein CpxP/Spy
MRSFLKVSAARMSLAATLSLPIAAAAQSPPTPPKQTTQSDTHRAAGQATPDRMEQRIADLHARLHITPDQQAQWDAFAQVMRDNAQHMRQAADDRANKLKTMNASENMLSYAQLAMRHAQDVQSLATAFQPLYATLSPDQQRTADVMFRDVGIPHRGSIQKH